MSVDVDRAKFEPGVEVGLTKFTHFISADGATIRGHTRITLRSRPPRGVSVRIDTGHGNAAIQKQFEKRREASTSSCYDKWGFDVDDDILMSGLPDLQRPVNASSENTLGLRCCIRL